MNIILVTLSIDEYSKFEQGSCEITFEKFINSAFSGININTLIYTRWRRNIASVNKFYLHKKKCIYIYNVLIQNTFYYYWKTAKYVYLTNKNCFTLELNVQTATSCLLAVIELTTTFILNVVNFLLGISCQILYPKYFKICDPSAI